MDKDGTTISPKKRDHTRTKAHNSLVYVFHIKKKLRKSQGHSLMCSDYSVSQIHQVAKFKEPCKVPYLIKSAATVLLLTDPWLFSLLLQFPALSLPTSPLGVDLTRTVQTLLASSKISKTSSLCLNYINDGLTRFLLSVLNPCQITSLKKSLKTIFLQYFLYSLPLLQQKIKMEKLSVSHHLLPLITAFLNVFPVLMIFFQSKKSIFNK